MVSRNRPETKDHQKSRDAGGREVSLPMITTEEGLGMAMSACSCGWTSKVRSRRKIAEDAAQRHLDKHHEGMGVWL